MKKKLLPVIAVSSLGLAICLFLLIGNLIEKYTPTNEHKDLSTHYNITSEDDVAIIYNNELITEKAKLINNIVYLSFDTINSYLNDRFYWDSHENILRYATANDLISIPIESTNYTVSKASLSHNHIIVKSIANTAYIAIDFVKSYSDFQYEVFENPNRIVITNAWGDYTVTTTKQNTKLRVRGGIKSPILTEIKRGSQVTILETLETWTEVITEDGIIGYVKANSLKGTTPETASIKTLTSDYIPEDFPHIKKDFEINMGWHQVINTSANDNISSILQNSKGINVISPTWFYLKDTNGNIGSLASTSYVDYCHQNGVEVWALVSNFGAKDQGLPNPDLTEILTYSSKRDNLINNLISAAIQYDLDGINVDFESVDPIVGDAYIQFIRELSLKCANNGLILSVDNYVPTAYTAFYDRSEQALFADYIIIMAYDEHHGNSETAGSTASIGFVTEGIENTLKEVPADQIILGMPFFSRVWSTVQTTEQTPSSEDSADNSTSNSVTSYSVGMAEQKRLLNVNGVEPVWLTDLGQYYAEYTKDQTLHQIWLEDATSLEEKLKVMDSYNLAGGAFWRMGLEETSVWDIIIKYIN